MLPSKNRLKTTDFRQIKKIPKKSFFSPNFSLSVARAEFEKTRFGVVVPASVSKKAVLRNKIRRRVKAVILKDLNCFGEGLAVVIYPQKKAVELTYAETESEVRGLFKKAKIIK